MMRMKTLFAVLVAALWAPASAQIVVRALPSAAPAPLAASAAVTLAAPSAAPALSAAAFAPALSAAPSISAAPEAVSAAPAAAAAAPAPALAAVAALPAASVPDYPGSPNAAPEAVRTDAARLFDGSALSFAPETPLAPVRVAEVAPNVFHLNFPTQYLVTSTFLRFQEHYESPKYRGKVFTLEEFMDWYAKEQGKNGEFTYFTDWAGFNIPSRVLQKFYAGEFNPLTVKEKQLLAMFAGRKEPFYLIGTYGEDDAETLRHEIAHGLFATNPEYRREVLAVLKPLKLKPVFGMLRDLGYHWRSWIDEAHAYIGDDHSGMTKRGIDAAPYADAQKKLLELYRKYSAEKAR